MEPKLREVTKKTSCSQTQNPLKGVGGAIVESVELKRCVSQTQKGRTKVFERAIEERQIAPGQSVTRIGTRIYYADDKKSKELINQMDNVDVNDQSCNDENEKEECLSSGSVRDDELENLEENDVVVDE